MNRNRLPVASRLFAVFAAAAMVGGFYLEWAGGFSARAYGIRVSAHGALRPVLAGLLCAAASYRLLSRADQDRIAEACSRVLRPWGALISAGAAVAVLGLGLAYGSRAAGGSDSYGYISQSQLWRAGHLRIHQDFVASMPWPDADWTFTPLAYRPAEAHTLVPTTAPGLPLLMALFTTISGSCGPYLVNPVFGALLVVVTFLVGTCLSSRAAGVAAALCMATSPTMLLMTVWPMSDVPAAAFWTGSMLLACAVGGGSLRGTGRARAGIAGAAAAAGAAILIRPNLAPLALFPALVALGPAVPVEWRRALRLLAIFCAVCAPFVLFVGVYFNTLYGSPLQSGYGETGSLYAWQNLGPNLARYPRWLWDTEGPLVFLFVLSPLVQAKSPPGSRRFCLMFIAAVSASYLWYLPFDVWWFLRFMLPAMPLIFVLGADVVSRLTAPFGARTRLPALAAFTLITITYGLVRTAERDVLGLRRDEQRYADVGRYVGARLPASAIVVAMQHSGSVRYYSGRVTLRYDFLDPAWIDSALAHLRAAGREPYVVLDKFEVPLFRQRFAGTASAKIVDVPPLAFHAGKEVGLYATDSVRRGEPSPIPVTSGCE